MKKMSLIFTLLVCLTAAQAKERVVERPFFTVATTTTLEIQQIALSDTATVFFIDAYNAPNQWIKIAKESYLVADDGQEYPVRSSTGISLGEEFYMPESGTASFQLVFPPLPASVKEVGFTEGDFQGSFQLWGIRLDGKPAGKAAPARKKSKEAPFLETPEFKQGNAVFSGKLLHYPAHMHAKLTVWKHDHVLNSQEEINIPVADDGTFRVEIPLYYPVMIACSPLLPHSVFLTPGEETSVVVNLPEITRAKSRLLKETPSLGESYAFSGKNAALNDEINNHPEWKVKPLIQSEKEFLGILSDVAGMSGEEFKAYWMERYAAGLREMETFTGISETYRRLQEQNLRMDIALRLFNPSGFLEYAYKRTHGLENDAPLPDEAKVEITDEYYSFVKDLVPNDPFGLYANYYGRMAQTLSMMEGQQLLPSIAALYGTDRGILFDLIALQRLAQPLTEFKPLEDDELAKVRAISPIFENLLTEKSDELKVKIEANKKKTGYTVHPSDDTNDIPNEELFAAVTQAHRGKVVFVDFWATWCGPCLQAMKMSEEAKKEMEEKGVIFLYLTGETSPMGTWQNMIPDIKGEHYRVTAGQWDYWSKFFGIQGIPFYLILGKQGDIAFTHLGFMGVDKMKEVLNTELEKPE